MTFRDLAPGARFSCSNRHFVKIPRLPVGKKNREGERPGFVNAIELDTGLTEGFEPKVEVEHTGE